MDTSLALAIRAIDGLSRRLVRSDEGQGMAEYGLILALVAVLCVVAFTSLKDSIVGVIGNVTSAM